MPNRNYNVDWEFILATIKGEKCILLLGPELVVTEEGKPFEQALVEHLDIANNENILHLRD